MWYVTSQVLDAEEMILVTPTVDKRVREKLLFCRNLYVLFQTTSNSAVFADLVLDLGMRWN